MNQLALFILIIAFATVIIFVFNKLVDYCRPASYMTLNSIHRWHYRPRPKSQPLPVRCFKCNHPEMLPGEVMRIDIPATPADGDQQGTKIAKLVPNGPGYFCRNCRTLYRTA